MQLHYHLGVGAGERDVATPGLGALDALSQPVLILDPDMHVLVANLAAGTTTAMTGSALRMMRVSHLRGGLARTLAGGATKAAVAGARGLRETTVRTHVRSVLDKTGAANLRELERMLAGPDGM